jgi:hypothetical protein
VLWQTVVKKVPTCVKAKRMGEVLEDWINPRYLTESVFAAASSRYHRDPCASLWLDDFLRQPRLEALRGLFRRDRHFAPWFGLNGDAGSNNLVVVDRSADEAAPPERRFEQETVLVGPKSRGLASRVAPAAQPGDQRRRSAPRPAGVLDEPAAGRQHGEIFTTSSGGAGQQ